MSALQPFLDDLCSRYHRPAFLASDPLEFVHRYEDPWDREAVALVAALLAYGNVRQIRRSVQEVLRRAEAAFGAPRGMVRALGRGEARDWSRAASALEGFVHRFNTGADLVRLFGLLGRSWKVHGSFGSHFLTHLGPEERTIESALDRTIADWRHWAKEQPEVRGAPGDFGYLLTAPRDGSCCKRWCMLLRWMGRSDELDPGLWAQGGALASTFPAGRFLRADQLVIPLDTHTGRISQYLALTRRKSLGWKAALEVTESLRECDPRDPVRYDFAIARLGILDLCQKRYRVEICRNCELRPACRFARKHHAPVKTAGNDSRKKRPARRQVTASR